MNSSDLFEPADLFGSIRNIVDESLIQNKIDQLNEDKYYSKLLSVDFKFINMRYIGMIMNKLKSYRIRNSIIQKYINEIIKELHKTKIYEDLYKIDVELKILQSEMYKPIQGDTSVYINNKEIPIKYIRFYYRYKDIQIADVGKIFSIFGKFKYQSIRSFILNNNEPCGVFHNHVCYMGDRLENYGQIDYDQILLFSSTDYIYYLINRDIEKQLVCSKSYPIIRQTVYENVDKLIIHYDDKIEIMFMKGNNIYYSTKEIPGLFYSFEYPYHLKPLYYFRNPYNHNPLYGIFVSSNVIYFPYNIAKHVISNQLTINYKFIYLIDDYKIGWFYEGFEYILKI